MIIKVENLTKTYKSYERGNTFREAVYSLFVRKTKYVEALKGISFTMERENWLASWPQRCGQINDIEDINRNTLPYRWKVDIMGYTPWKDRKKYVAHIGAVFGQKSQLLWTYHH